MISDFKELLEVLNACGVRYLIVGGYAVMKYTEPRLTKDLDLWVATDRENAERVYAALARFGAPLAGYSPADFTNEEFWFQVGVAPVRVDVLLSISGVNFDEAWNRREDDEFLGTPAHFISRADLILAKEAAGRPQDRRDLRRLRKSPG
jgi:Nucleotidyl transferase of unknown function (DUF2204)